MSLIQKMWITFTLTALSTFIKNPKSVEKERYIIQEIRDQADQLLAAIDAVKQPVT